ncbi:hypothetical protein SPRG_15613, partial [Saprolegnia parasitica CBS 223.65]
MKPEEGAEPLCSDLLAHKHLQRMIKDTKLSAPLLAALPAAMLGDWAASNRGAFVLVAFLDHAEAKKTLSSAVKAKKLSKEAKAQAGTKLLLEKLDL